MKHILLAISILIGSSIFSQDTFEGEITFSLDYEDLSEQVAPYKAMLPKSSTAIIKHSISKVITPNGMGGETVVITDSETGEMLTLMNQMGNKIALKTNMNDSEKPDNNTIEYLDETKEIMGYECKKALVTDEEGNEVEVYYTEELDHIKYAGQIKNLKGFPMQIIISQEMFTIIQTVEKIETKKIKKIKLDVPSDYELKTLEELKEMQGGM